MKYLTTLEKKRETWFLIIASFIFFLLRIPSLFEPYWYGDEGIYQVIGMAMNQGRLLYLGIWDHKPPLLYVIYAIFHADQPTIRFVSLLAGLASFILFFYVAKRLFQNDKIAFITTGVFGFLLATPILEGNIANAENFIIPLTLAAALLIFKTLDSQEKHMKHNVNKLVYYYQLLTTHYLLFFYAGLLLGLAFTLKVVALMDFAAFFFFIFLMQYKSFKAILKQIPNLASLTIGFALPIVICVLYYVSQHAVGEFIKTTFFTNVDYVNYGNKFIIPQGLLVIKTIVLALFCGTVFFFRKKIGFSNLFIYLWLVFSIYNALLSQRPYVHYVLVAIASFSLFLGVVFASKKFRELLIVAFVLVLQFLLFNFHHYDKFIVYYGNFWQFVTNQESVDAYRRFFDPINVRDYAIADFINMQRRPGDNVFIWGSSGQLYKLTNTLPPGRYIVAFHIVWLPGAVAETGQALQKANPRFVIIMPNQPTYPYSLKEYTRKFMIQDATIYERIL